MAFNIEKEIDAFSRKEISRQEFLAKGLAGGLSLTAATALLAGCTGSNNANTGSNPNAGIKAKNAYLGGDGSFARALKDGLRAATFNAAPYTFTDSSGNLTGFDAELFREASKRLGLLDKVKYTIGDWTNLIPSLHAKRLDFIFVDFHMTPEREAQVDFTGPMFFYGDDLVVRKGNPLNLHSWQDLAGHTVGALEGESYVDWLNKRKDLKGVKLYKDYNNEIQDLAAGRVDAIIGETPVVSYYLSQHTDAQIEAVPDYTPQSDLNDWTRWGVQQGAHDLNNAYTRVVDEMRVDGTMYKILSKYGMPAASLQYFKGMPKLGT